MVVENVGERRNTLPSHAVIYSRSLETQPREVADRLGSIVVAVVFRKIGEFGDELVRHADRQPLNKADPVAWTKKV
jgi:hypothetical protein